MQSQTCTRHEIADLFGFGATHADTQRRRINDLMARHGFPRMLPGLRVWSRALVEAWIAANGSAPKTSAPQQDFPMEVRARLEARIRARSAA